MKMKYTSIIYLLISILALGNISCKKFLDVPPQGKLTQDQFWKNREQAIAAIAGIYSNLGSTRWDFTANGNLNPKDMSPVEAYTYWGEMRGDLLASQPGSLPSDQNIKENLDNLLVSPNDVTTKYTDFYRIINEANLAIKNIPNIPSLDPSLSIVEANQLIGEALFIRAYAYFWLVRTFKEVPLILEPSETDQQEYNIAKSSADVILAQIVQDLTTAKNTLPEWYTNTQYSHSRATRYTALTVLSDASLWMAATLPTANKSDLYTQVISNCDAIITSNRFGLIRGDSFGTIFLEGNTVESIFETYSNSTVNGQTNNLKNWFETYFIVPSSVDGFFATGDYRGYTVPSGSSVISYNQSNRFIQKYNRTTNDARWIFYRYPDVLFMKAEALAHLFPDDVDKLLIAAGLVNEVRERAFTPLLFTPVDATSTAAMDELLLEERAREFVGEGKRWFDLMRFASRDNFNNKNLLIDPVLNSFPSSTRLIMRPRLETPDSWYLPLNTDALNANIKLEQNPYYK
ncbi:MAG: RagB/SusD family nutrient uptake outer membrane protein [Sphingobacteriales bacterium]|nr:RagB/SusD family nutrient uptake outer membrane protein [Sphingobacteriales bacterium]